MNNILFLEFMVTCLFLLLLWVSNFKLKKRYLQLPIVCLAIGYTIVIAFCLYQGQTAYEIFESISGTIAKSLGSVSEQAKFVYNDFLTDLKSRMEGTQNGYIFPLAANMLLLAIFSLAKLIVQGFVKFFQSIPACLAQFFHLINRLLQTSKINKRLPVFDFSKLPLKIPFIFHGKAGNKVIIKNKYLIPGIVFRTCGIIMFVFLFCGLVFDLLINNKSFITIFIPSYPVLGLIIFWELGWFLSGIPSKTSISMTVDRVGEESGGSYKPLWARCQKIWKSKLLGACLWSPIRLGCSDYRKFGSGKGIGEESCRVWDSLTSLRRGNEIDDNAIFCMEDYDFLKSLWDGDDLLVSTVDGERVEPILNSAFRRNLMDGKTILVVVDHANPLNSHRLNQTTQWVERTLNGGARYYRMWNIMGFEEFQSREECDVLIASFRQLLGYSKINTLDWFKHLGIIVIPNISRVLSDNDVMESKTAAALLDDIADERPQWLLFTDPAEDDVVSTEWVLPMDLKRITMRRKKDPTVLISIFKLEGKPFQDFVFNGQHTDDLGAEAVLALPAREEVAGNIWFVNSKGVPWDSHTDKVAKYIPSLNISEISLSALDGMNSGQPFELIDTPLFFGKQERPFIYIRDEQYNIGKAVNDWSQCGHKETITTVVSPPYLFRDYFTAYLPMFIENPVSPIFPMPAESPVNVASFLLNYLSRKPMTYDRLLLEIRKVYPDEIYPDQGLLKLINKYFKDLNMQDREHLHRDEEVRFNPELKDYETVDVFSFLSSILSIWKTKNEMEIKEHRTFLGSVLTEHVDQIYLKGQLHVFKGRTYEVLSVDRETKTVRMQLREVPVPLEYRPVLRVRVSGKLNFDDEPILFNGFTMYKYLYKELEYSVTTLGYLEFQNDLNLESVITKIITPKVRKYPYGRMFHLQIDAQRGENHRNATFTLALLLNEAFKTFYPGSYQFIKACSPYVPEEMRGLIPKIEFDAEVSFDNSLNVFLIEDSRSDMGLLPAFDDNLLSIFNLLIDYIDWCLCEKKTVDGGPICCLQKFTNKLKFLCFGKRVRPTELELEKVRDILKIYVDQKAKERAEDAVTHEGRDFVSEYVNDGLVECCYCSQKYSKPAMNLLDGHRYICRECKRSVVEKESELTATLKKALTIIGESYGSKIEEELHVSFTTQDKIEKARQGYFMPLPSSNARVVGVAKKHGNSYTILVENKAPYNLVMFNLLHELTHIWQFINLDFDKMDDALQLSEGHAQWVGIEYLKRNKTFSSFMESEMKREDVYGKGYRQVKDMLKEEDVKNPFELFLDNYSK